MTHEDIGQSVSLFWKNESQDTKLLNGSTVTDGIAESYTNSTFVAVPCDRVDVQSFI